MSPEVTEAEQIKNIYRINTARKKIQAKKKTNKKTHAWVYFSDAVSAKVNLSTVLMWTSLLWFQLELLFCQKWSSSVGFHFSRHSGLVSKKEQKMQHVSRLWENEKENEENVVYLTGGRFLFSLFIFSLHIFCPLTAEGITNWCSREEGRSLLTYLGKKKHHCLDLICHSFFFPLSRLWAWNGCQSRWSGMRERYLIT